MDEFLKGFLSENERTGDPTSKWVEDADLLKELIAEQALYQYVSGDYKCRK